MEKGVGLRTGLDLFHNLTGREEEYQPQTMLDLTEVLEGYVLTFTYLRRAQAFPAVEEPGCLRKKASHFPGKKKQKTL